MYRDGIDTITYGIMVSPGLGMRRSSFSIRYVFYLFLVENREIASRWKGIQ